MSDSGRIALVQRHLAGWEDIERFIATIADTCTDDLVWANSGLPTTHGLDQARDMLRQFGIAFRAIAVDYLSVIDVDGRVWTERTDYMIDHQGQRALTCPTMGIFEFRGDRICSWRDYFDASPFKRKRAA